MKENFKIPTSLKDVKFFKSQKEAVQFYHMFLKSLEDKEYDASIQLENHHIIPLHENGPDTEENIIKISPEDHVAIHFYRYQAFKKDADRKAFYMRLNDSNEKAKLRAQAAVQANKAKGQLFWNSDWQRLQGLKGGSKGGSRNTLAQWNARQKVGLEFGRSVGLKNQSSESKEFLKHHITWKHESDDRIFETTPAIVKIDVIRQLEDFKPGYIKNPSSFYKVMSRERKQMYGWKIVNMEIRSEAKEDNEIS